MLSPVRAVPQRVLLTTDAVGGVWHYTLDLAGAYLQRGIEVDLVVLGPKPAPIRMAEAAALPRLQLIWSELPLEWMADDATAVNEAGARLIALANTLNPDIIHLSNPALAAGAGAFPAPLVVTMHSCIASWWEAVRPDEPMPQDFHWRRQLIHDGLQAADAVAVPSAAFAQIAGKLYSGVSFQVAHNGRNDGLPPAGEQPRFGAFTSGRLWDEAKNLRTLNQVSAQLAAPICAAGPHTGPNGATIELLDMCLLGDLPNLDVRHWLRSSSVYVTTTLYEPFGLGVLEAAQAGCALVLSDIPVFRELWDGAAWFVPPQDPDAIADTVKILMSDDAARRDAAEKACERSRTYSSASMAEAMLGIYQTTLEQRQTSLECL